MRLAPAAVHTARGLPGGHPRTTVCCAVLARRGASSGCAAVQHKHTGGNAARGKHQWLLQLQAAGRCTMYTLDLPGCSQLGPPQALCVAAGPTALPQIPDISAAGWRRALARANTSRKDIHYRLMNIHRRCAGLGGALEGPCRQALCCSRPGGNSC